MLGKFIPPPFRPARVKSSSGIDVGTFWIYDQKLLIISHRAVFLQSSGFVNPRSSLHKVTVRLDSVKIAFVPRPAPAAHFTRESI